MLHNPSTARDGAPIGPLSSSLIRRLVFDEPPIEPLPDMDAPPPPRAHPKPLAEHRRGECLWPLGPAQDPGDWRTLFCCAPVWAGCGYCPDHAARAFRPDPDAALASDVAR